MKITNPELYDKILSLEMDETNIDFTFSDRLCRENRWKNEYSKRCIVEYKKFIYLSAISNKSLTPSDQIDQVWHLHLTYTQSYWVNLCRNVLDKEIHHCPTKGGALESNKYKEQYQQTINFYKNEFGENPPDDIWPGVEKRFKNADKFVRVNASEYTIFNASYQFIALIFFIPIIAYAGEDSGNENDIWFYIKIAFGVYVVYKIIKWLIGDNGKGSGGAGCSGCSGCGAGCGS